MNEVFNNRYIFVKRSDAAYVDAIFKILLASSFHLARQFLFHWIPPYSKKAIRKDCDTKSVVLVKDEDLQEFTSTFQMLVKADRSLYVRKVATHPKYAGRGIGKENLLFMEQFGRQKGCTKICLEVYVKSKAAVSFYLHNGFVEVGTKRSIRYKEFMFEKGI